MNGNAFDVVIVGGGVIGTSVAYYLSKEKNLSVALIDIRKPGVASWASAGGLWPMGESVGLGCGVIFFHTISQRISDVEESGQDFIPHMLPKYLFEFSEKSNAMFPQLYEELKVTSEVDFEFLKNGLLFLMYDDYDKKYGSIIERQIPKEYKKYLKALSREEIIKMEPYVNKEIQGGILFTEDHHVNPYMLVKAYRDSAQVNGVTIIDDSEVTGIEVKDNRVISVNTSVQGRITCGTMVNAAGVWATEIGEMVGLKLPITPVKGEVVLSEKLPKILNASLSTSDCYINQKANGELIIGSTTEEGIFDVMCNFDKIKALVLGAVKAVPILSELDIKRTWAGLRPGTPDETPILGPVSGLDGYINACGHFRTGIVNSPITGVMIRNFLLGGEQPMDIEPFLYKRFENVNIEEVTASYLTGEEE